MDKPVSRRIGFWIETLLPKAVYAYAQWDAPVFHLIGNTPRTEQQFAPSITFTLHANTPTRCIYNQPACTLHQVANRPTIYQISINPNVDTVNVSDISIGDYASIIGTDTVIAADYLTGSIWAEPLSDTLNIQDAIVGDWYGSFSADTPVVTEALSGVLSITQASTETVYASENLSTDWSAVSADTVSLLSVLMGSPELQGALSDSIIVTDTLAATLTATTVTADIETLFDSVAAGFVATASATLTLADSLAGALSATTATVDVLNVSETLSSIYAIYGYLTDTGILTDAMSGSLSLVGTLTDTALVTDSLLEDAQKIVVINADTGAVSTYTLTTMVTGLAYFNGTLYLSGSDGLYALDAAVDVDGPIAWFIKTGFSNLGTDLLKRVRDVNVQGRTDGTIQCTMTINRTGNKQAYGPFILPPFSRASYRDGVIKIGKGLQSDYWQLQLAGTGVTEIDQLRLSVELLNRRR